MYGKHITRDGSPSSAALQRRIRWTTASVCIQQLDFIVIYLLGGLHLVPGALSRLARTVVREWDDTTDILDYVANVFHTLIVDIDDDFKLRLKDAYKDDEL